MTNEDPTQQKPYTEEQSYLLTWDPESQSAFLRFFGFNTLVTIIAYGDDRAMPIEESREGCDSYKEAIAEHHANDMEHKLTSSLKDCYDACVRFESLFSRTIPTSDIGRLNNAEGKPVPIDHDTFAMLQTGKEFCEASDGIFDITIGAATTLWDFHEGIVPAPQQLAEAVKHIDWHQLRVAEEDGSWFAQLMDSEAMVDVGGIAKGWIADRLAELLAAAGVEAALIDLGGNVTVLGQKPDGSPWKIGIRDPQTTVAQEGYLGVVELNDGSIATSGTYERCFHDGNANHHHILDVRTGKSLEVPWASASVVADDATQAEGFSTTMLSLDEKGARSMMEAHPEIRQVIFVSNDSALTIVDRD